MRQTQRKKTGAGEASMVEPAFLSLVSQDIRPPVSGMLGMAGLLLETSLDPVQRRYVAAIEGAAERAMGLLDDLLDRPEAGMAGFRVQPYPFDLHESVTRAVDLFSGWARQKGISLHLSVSPATPRRVLGDARRLEQILTNLVANAVKFTKSGSVDVFVEPEASGRDSSRVCFRVADSGIGMGPDMLSRLFRPYVRASAGVAGSGLGLAISHALAQRMGGGITVESVPGQGSVFTLCLPLPPSLPADGNQEAGAVPEEGEAGSIGLSFSGRRVLLAEDDAINREVARAMLESLGCEVCCVESGAQVIEQVCREVFDLVLLDCRMPGMSGLEAAGGIRNHEALHARQRVPVIALTASATRDEQEACRASGMDGLLLKPLDRVGLIRLLRHWCIEPVRQPDFPVTRNSCLDPQVLKGLWQLEKMGRPGLLARVVELFRERAQRLPGELLAACMTENADQVRHLAHNLRSASAHVGATVLVSLAADLEEQARLGRLRFVAAGDVAQTMELEFRRVSQALGDYMEQLRHE